MKRQPTEIVALVLHGCTTILSALMWLRARTVFERDFRDFGGALPALTQSLYAIHFPAVLFVGLVASFVAAAADKGSATLVISSTAAVFAVISLALIWWALRLPFLPL